MLPLRPAVKSGWQCICVDGIVVPQLVSLISASTEKETFQLSSPHGYVLSWRSKNTPESSGKLQTVSNYMNNASRINMQCRTVSLMQIKRPKRPFSLENQHQIWYRSRHLVHPGLDPLRLLLQKLSLHSNFLTIQHHSYVIPCTAISYLWDSEIDSLDIAGKIMPANSHFNHNWCNIEVRCSCERKGSPSWRNCKSQLEKLPVPVGETPSARNHKCKSLQVPETPRWRNSEMEKKLQVQETPSRRNSKCMKTWVGDTPSWRNSDLEKLQVQRNSKL